MDCYRCCPSELHSIALRAHLSCHLTCLPLSSQPGVYLLAIYATDRPSTHLCLSSYISSLISRISRIYQIPIDNMSFNLTSDGSPTPRKTAPRFPPAYPDLRIDTSPEVLGHGPVGTRTRPHPLAYQGGVSLTYNTQGAKRPLGSSTMGNQMLAQPNIDAFKVSQPRSKPNPSATSQVPFAMKKWSTQSSLPQKAKMEQGMFDEPSVVDSLLQRLNERSSPHDQYGSSNGSVPLTPATDEFASTPNTEPDTTNIKTAELRELKAQLAEARDQVARANQELHSTHVAKSTVEHLGQSSEADYTYSGEVTEQTLAQLQNKFNAANRTNYAWGNETRQPFFNAGTQQAFSNMQAAPRPPMNQQAYRGRNNLLNEPTHFPLDQSFRGGSNPPSRPASAFDPPMFNQYVGPQMYTPYQPTPIGSMAPRLSPEASEFSVDVAMGPSPWNSQV